MRGLFPIYVFCHALAAPALAQDLTYPLACSGQSPDWELGVNQDSAVFDFGRESQMTVALDTVAQDATWPRALTLVGRGDSAILLLENTRCETGNLTARILTQRGETPLLLTGCCETP